LDDEGAQGGLERYRMIAGDTKTSRSKLVEQATWEKDVGPGGMVVTQAGRFSFFFFGEGRKDGHVG
jgi:hypothetical protein